MRMVDFPVDLPFSVLTPDGGPDIIGITQSATKKQQTSIDPWAGLWSFTLEIAALQEAAARAFTRLSISAHSGANCFRLPFFDPHEPTWSELGLNVGEAKIDQYQNWTNDTMWAHGLPWGTGKPLAQITAASAKDSGQISIDLSAWSGVLPTFFGIVGHFAVYGVQGARFAGDIATVKVWPPVRKAITVSDYATLRPVMCAKVDGKNGASWSSVGRSKTLEGARLSVIEVPDETVREYVTEDYP